MSVRIVILSGLALALTAPVAPAPAAPAAAAAPSAAQGKQVASAQSCTMCHVSGGMAKPFSAYAGESATRLKAAILDPKKTLGASTMMPPYEGKLSAGQLDALVAFIKSGGH